ncbi:MAG TPA: hypothetical protein VES67_10155 [Vicinamibacterales bacterium]|nr:hypothetical protein [Vicinamibacterales bacterium]
MLGILRAAALVAVVVGACGSFYLMLRAGNRNSSLVLLVILFTIWVLAPFAVLAWALVVSKRWQVPTRVALYNVTLVVALGSLACYSELVPKPAGAPNVFMFVAVPPASLVLMAIMIAMAALVSRRRSH